MSHPSASDHDFRARRRGALSPTAVSVMAAACLCLVASCTPAENGDVVARVGGREITVGDLLGRLREVRGPSVLVEMIDARLITSAAVQAGIEVGDEELQVRLQRAVAEAGSDADFAVALQQRGQTREQFTEALRLDALLDKLVMAGMAIQDQEVRDFYGEHREEFRLGETVRARMMMFASREDAQAVRDTLGAGGDFDGLARALSTDPGTADRGGEMGWFERDGYAEEITKVAFDLQPGELSQPFQAPDGWVILQVEERKPPGFRPLEEVRAELLARIQRGKLPDLREQWIRRARAEATIRITDDDLREATLELLKSAPAPQPVSLLPVPLPAQ